MNVKKTQQEINEELQFLTELDVAYRHKRSTAVGRAQIDQADARIKQIARIRTRLTEYQSFFSKATAKRNQATLFE